MQNGFPVAPRFSVAADPEAAATSPIVTVVDRLAKRNLLKSWPRPPVPEYLSLEAILGEEIHRALRKETSDKEALEKAQTQADQIMRAAGYYCDPHAGHPSFGGGVASGLPNAHRISTAICPFWTNQCDAA